MKKLIVALFACSALALAFMLLAHATPRADAASASMKRYQIASAIVEYTLSGTQTGTETLYFTDYGMREAKYTHSEIKVASITQKSNRVVLMEGATTYNIDLDAKTGTKIENPFFKKFEGQDATEAGEKMLRDMGGQKIGTESFLGKTCEVWEIKKLGSKMWVWSGIPLKTETDLGGMQVFITATKLEPNASIPPEKLAIPAGVKISSGPDFKKLREGLQKKTRE